MSDTKEIIQARLLGNIADTYDKTEGSFFYDAEKPVAIELESAYAEQEAITDKGFVETAEGSFLDLKVGEQGITRKAATSATATLIVTGTVGASVTVGDLFSSDTANYEATATKVIDETGTVNISVECQTPGAIGNVPIGAIKYFPVTIAGLNTVINELAVEDGYAGETDAELRIRFYEKARTPATSGNKYHYRNWVKEVAGVGDAKVFPIWNGAGTVKVVIIDSNKTGAEAGLVAIVQTYIDDVRPIGATVTVASAIELPININVTVTRDAVNYTLPQVKAAIESNMTNYLKEIAFIDGYLSYAKVGSLILDTSGVLDYSVLSVNNGTSNVTIAATSVVVLGVVTVV